MKLWQLGVIIGIIWGLISLDMTYNIDLDFNPETGKIEYFNEDQTMLYIIWIVPLFLGSWILVFIWPLIEIFPNSDLIDNVSYALYLLSYLISTPLFLGGLGALFSRLYRKMRERR
jgi:hypothetical protein